MSNLECNARLVKIARNLANVQQVKLDLISKDPQEAARAAQLRADIDQLNQMADRWEQNPSQ